MLGELKTGALTGEVGEGFDEYLFYLLYQVTSRRNRDFASPLSALDLTPPLWRALSTINRLGGCLMSELAEFTNVDRTTLTRTVDHLVASDLVVRKASATDRRLVCLELSDHGQDVFARAVEVLTHHNLRALKDVSEHDQRILRATLQRILVNLVPEETLFEQLLHFRR